jgi:hypothetical protein
MFFFFFRKESVCFKRLCHSCSFGSSIIEQNLVIINSISQRYSIAAGELTIENFRNLGSFSVNILNLSQITNPYNRVNIKRTIYVFYNLENLFNSVQCINIIPDY